MAKEKDKNKRIKRLQKQLYSYADQPSTRPGRTNPMNYDEPVEDNGTVVLTHKSRIMHALKTLQNTSKKK